MNERTGAPSNSIKPDRVGIRYNTYKVGRKIGEGGFGDVFAGTTAFGVCAGEEVAIKLEPVKSDYPQLIHESKVLKSLQLGVPDVGLPKFHWSGTERNYNVMVIERLGPSLEKLFNLCSRRLSSKTVFSLAVQMVSCLEHVHSKGFLHCDIKPDNFLMGVGKQTSKVYLIDFGIARRYINSRSRHHLPCSHDNDFAGTERYASVNTHLGLTPSRRDDLESLGYVLVYLIAGRLPWQGVRAASDSRRRGLVSDLKASTTPEQLCKGFPAELIAYLTYARALGFEEDPDYDYLRALFRGPFLREEFQDDGRYDWHPPPLAAAT